MTEKSTQLPKEFISDWIKFQTECPAPPRKGKAIARGNKEYNYALLDDIISTIQPFLKKHNFGFTQPQIDDMQGTIIFHTSGATLESWSTIPQTDNMQHVGMYITYLRRYQLNSITGIPMEDDVDAAIVESAAKEQKTKPKSEPKTGENGLPYPTAGQFKKIIDGLKAGHNKTSEVYEHFDLTEGQKAKVDLYEK